MVESTEKLIFDYLEKERPKKISDAIQGLASNKISLDKKILFRDIMKLVKAGKIKVENMNKKPEKSLFSLLLKFPLINNFMQKYLKEPIIKSIFFIIIINMLSWLLLLFFRTSAYLILPRIIFVGTSFLFLPGFSLTLLWYPFKSELLNIISLSRRNNSKTPTYLDLISRIGYSIAYSIALIILIGFLIGVTDLGFDQVLLHLIFTILEIYAIVKIVLKIKRIKDPYRDL